MGTQKMGSQGGGGGSQQERRKSDFHHQNPALGRQGSLYSLTLDEIEHQLGDLGKPLSSMNLDELLKSVCTAEEVNNNQYQGIGGSGGGDYAGTSAAQHNPPLSLHRQSSLTLSRDLSKKTVDEVWQHILIQQQQHQQQQKNKKKKNSTSTDSSLDGLNQAQEKERQPTLGEMTLEDFLVKAGVVAESAPILGMKTFSSGGTVFGADPIAALAQPQPHSHPPQQSMPQLQPPQSHWMSYQQQQQNMLGPVYMAGHPLPICANPIVEVPSAYPETQMPIMATTSPSMGTISDTQTPGRKRVAGDVAERTVERRQKRMIKNRESAARSRARKQAYTHELENKVSRLEEENKRLKRQKEVEKILPCVPPPEPKYQLRRTSSAPF
ncbi:hypothetical protein NMG60_11031152 [Bertholletia excelsa]